MIVVANSNGTILATVPTPIYQGGTLGGNLYLLSPRGAETPATVAFKLPNGVQTNVFTMTSVATVAEMPEELIDKFNIWSYEYNDPSITANAGDVTCQFTFYETRRINGVNKLMPIATSSVIFTVQKGVEPVINENDPTADQWLQITQALSGLSGRITNVENQLPALKTFSISGNGVLTKYYTDGSTIVSQLPDIPNLELEGSPGIKILNFTTTSWGNPVNSRYDLVIQNDRLDDNGDCLYVVQEVFEDVQISGQLRNGYKSFNADIYFSEEGYVLIEADSNPKGRLIVFQGLNINKFVSAVKLNSTLYNGISVSYGDGSVEDIAITEIYKLKLGEQGQLIAEGLEEGSETEIFRLAFEGDKLVIKSGNGLIIHEIANLSFTIDSAYDWYANGKSAVEKNKSDISTNKTNIMLLRADLGTVFELTNENRAKANANATAIAGLQADVTNREHFRGYYPSNGAVNAIQNPHVGDFCYNAETGTKWVYDGESGVRGWYDTGSPVPDQTVPKATTVPLMDGAEAKIGESNEYAAADHVHPQDSGLRGGIQNLENMLEAYRDDFVEEIGELGDSVSANTTAIEQNTTAIAQNTEAIAQNTADIEELKQGGGTSAGIPIEKVGF